MDSSNLLSALRRRWYVVVAGILLTCAGAVAVSQFVPPTYTASANILFLPPQSTQQTGGNPYLALDGLSPAAAAVGLAMSDDATTRALKQAGATGSFTVIPDTTTSGPVLLVSTTDTTAQGAVATLRLVAKEIPRTLSRLQAQTGAPRRSFITSATVADKTTATTQHKGQIRALLVVTAGGIALTLILASLIDGIILARRHPLPRSAGASDLRGASSGEHLPREPARLRPPSIPAGKRVRAEATGTNPSRGKAIDKND